MSFSSVLVAFPDFSCLLFRHFPFAPSPPTFFTTPCRLPISLSFSFSLTMCCSFIVYVYLTSVLICSSSLVLLIYSLFLILTLHSFRFCSFLSSRILLYILLMLTLLCSLFSFLLPIVLSLSLLALPSSPSLP